MAFRNILQGGTIIQNNLQGPCNANDSSQSQNSNPFYQFMNQMLLGNSANQQSNNLINLTQIRQLFQQQQIHQDGQVMNNIQQHQEQYQMMNDHWNQIIQNDQKQMQDVFDYEARQYEEIMRQNMIIWQQAKIQQEADQLAQEYKFQEIWENSVTEQKINQIVGEELIQEMRQDPKFKDSKFIAFMDRLQNGEIKIQGNQLLNADGTVVKNSSLDEDIDYDKIWNERLEEYERLRSNDVEFQKMLEGEYIKILQQIEKNGDDRNELLSESWQKASDIQEQSLFKDATDLYQFQQNNQYSKMEFPLKEAIRLTGLGLSKEAILSLEAHLQRHQNDADAWRIMGHLHQEMDQDQQANSLKYDGSNLNTLNSLGVSCTNILDEVKAMYFLKQWILCNSKYQGLQFDPNIIPNIDREWTIQEIKEMNSQLKNIFNQAYRMNPNDVELINALAVLQFISRDYDHAVELFKKALQIEPKNYHLWNKLGATLAHLGEADQSIFCYHRALDLRPNYVKTWVNLGIAYSYKGDYHEAARLYINALQFNPNAKHIWGYLQSQFMMLSTQYNNNIFSFTERKDLVVKIQYQDPKVFLDEFPITFFTDLPEPEILYNDANMEYIFKTNLNQWLNKYAPK